MGRAGKTPMFMLIFAALMLIATALCGLSGISSVLDMSDSDLVVIGSDISAVTADLSDVNFELFSGSKLSEQQREKIIDLLDNSLDRLNYVAMYSYNDQFVNEVHQTIDILGVYREKLDAVMRLLPEADDETRKTLHDAELAPLYNELSSRLRMLNDYNTSIQYEMIDRTMDSGNYNTIMFIVVVCITMICMCPMLIVAFKGIVTEDGRPDTREIGTISELEQLEARIKRLEEKN